MYRRRSSSLARGAEAEAAADGGDEAAGAAFDEIDAVVLTADGVFTARPARAVPFVWLCPFVCLAGVRMTESCCLLPSVQQWRGSRRVKTYKLPSCHAFVIGIPYFIELLPPRAPSVDTTVLFNDDRGVHVLTF